MSNPSVLAFVRAALPQSCVVGRTVLEVGAYDRANDSVRQVLEPLNPGKYVGVDLEPGPGVDEIVNITALASHFGEASFAVVVCTETIEHVEDWRAAISQLKLVVEPGGVLLVTTRSRGFHLHAYPHDYWRYDRSDFERIFSDMCDVHIAEDTLAPGLFAVARKPSDYRETSLDDLRLYSVAFRRRILGTGRALKLGRGVTRATILFREFLKRVLPQGAILRLQRRLRRR